MNELVIALLVLAGAAAAYLAGSRVAAPARRKQSGTASGGGRASPNVAPDRSIRAEDIIERMSEGVVVLDATLKPVLSNGAARKMLGFRSTRARTRLPSEDVLALVRRALNAAEEVSDVIHPWFPARSSIKVTVMPMQDSGATVLLQDVTAEQRAQQTRKEFVAHASHELKSPVAGIQSLAEAVADAVEHDPLAATRLSERLVVEAHRLGRLIGDLLDLSRLEEAAKLQQEPVELSVIAHHELDGIRSTVADKHLELDAGVDPGVWIRGDNAQIALMIRNLLDNAVRYTPEGGRIALRVHRDSDDAVVEVADTGIGIPLEAQGRIFERFYRLDKARSRERGGTGLGLAIVKHVAEIHGGSVSLTSELGEGSRFRATLPALSAPTSAAAGE